MDYLDFIKSKQQADVPTGFDCADLGSYLFDFQQAIVKWALKRGRAAIFADTGMGKTAMQTTWAQRVHEHTDGNVLLVAPLCVAQQTVEEAAKFGITVRYCRSQDQVQDGLTITNYEMLDKFDLDSFVGVVLDESSILKSHTSKTREAIIDGFRMTPYKLSCTATPSPNDYIELGNQAQFLGVMNQQEMLATFFTHDGGDTSKWRLKGHGKVKFWEWMATWAICVRNPADLGFDGSRYILPPLRVTEHVVESGDLAMGQLFPMIAQSLSERREAKRASLDQRIEKTLAIVANSCQRYKMAGIEDHKDALNGLETGICSEPQNEGANRSRVSGQAKCAIDEGQGRSQGVHEGVLRAEHAEISSHAGATGEVQPEAEGGICRQRGAARVCSSEGQGVAGEQSAKTQSATHIEVRTDDGSVRSNDAGTESPVRDMRAQRPVEQKLLSCGGSLSYNGESPRIDLHELQSGSRKIQRQYSIAGEGDCVPQTIPEPFLIWCHLNEEQDQLEKAFGKACFSVRGAMSPEEKEKAVMGWLQGERPIMISKPSILGFGLNFQHCRNMIFAGMDDSFESYYQAVRRCYRFGQKKAVNVHLITADTEGAVKANIERKQEQANEMAAQMVELMREITKRQIVGARSNTETYNPTLPMTVPEWIYENVDAI